MLYYCFMMAAVGRYNTLGSKLNYFIYCLKMFYNVTGLLSAKKKDKYNIMNMVIMFCLVGLYNKMSYCIPSAWCLAVAHNK